MTKTLDLLNNGQFSKNRLNSTTNDGRRCLFAKSEDYVLFQ